MVKRRTTLVAYDLGLGKTVLTIAAVESLMDDLVVTEPGLVICLSSLKFQWADQIRQFTEGSEYASHPLVIDGNPKQRREQYALAMDWMTTGVDYIIMNYEQVVKDWAIVRKLPMGFIVLDEATAIKSFRAKRSRLIKKLQSEVRFALTGTPIENGKPEEIYSIMEFVDRSVLGRFDHFDATFIERNSFGGVERYKNLPTLHRRLQPALVRKSRTDPDVAPYLPEAIIKEPLRVAWDPAGAKLYRRMADDILADLDECMDLFGGQFSVEAHYGYGEGPKGGPEDEMRGRLMSKITCMRMLCDHPALVKRSADKFAIGNGEGSQYAYDLDQDGWLDPLKRTPKLDALSEYVRDFLETDDSYKVVIFSVFVPTLAFIEQRLAQFGCVQYSGLLNAKQKHASKLQFQTDPDTRILISSDAGGYGVDLPQANMLVNYDLPWSSGAATQRNGRVMRASSQWAHVLYQDFLMRGSVEERQWQLIQHKSAVAAAVVDGRGINHAGGIDFSVDSLRSFLERA